MFESHLRSPAEVEGKETASMLEVIAILQIVPDKTTSMKDLQWPQKKHRTSSFRHIHLTLI